MLYEVITLPPCTVTRPGLVPLGFFTFLMGTTCRYSAAEKTGPDGRTGGETLIAHMREALAARQRNNFV